MMNRARTLAYLVALSLLFGAACDGCGACSDDPIEGDAQTRITDLSSLLPATADAAVVIPELRELPTTLDYTFSRLEHFDPDARATENRLNQLLGLRITDIESWDAAGFAPDSSMIFAMVGARPVMAAYIDDKNAFETHFIGRLRRLSETNVPIQNNTMGDQTFRVSGTPPMSDMAWYIEDSKVVLVFPPSAEFGTLSTGSAASVANVLGSVAEDTSLAQSEAFQEFRHGVGDDYPISLYVHAGQYFERPEVAHGEFGLGGVGTLLETLINWSQSNAEGTGIGYRAGDSRLELRAYAGGDEALLEDARTTHTTEADTEWQGLLTENTTLAARTGFDLSGAVDTYFESLPDGERQRAEAELQQLGQQYDLDINEDIFGALSGHSLLVFYGVGGNIDRAVSPFAQGNIMRGLQIALANAGLVFNLHFSDPDKMQTLMGAASTNRSDLITRRPLHVDGEPVDGFEVLEPMDLNAFPFRIFASERSLTWAASGIGESAAHQYLTDARDETRLSDAEGLALGNEFAQSDGLNGLYLNFGNLRNNMRNIPLLSGYSNTIRMLKELLVTGGVDDRGFYLSAKLDFTDPIEDSVEQ